MESPWRQQQQQHGDSHRHPRGSLGLFIERSTSAPPMSSFEQQPGSLLMGNDLLDTVTKEYSGMSLSKPRSSLQRAAGGNNDYEQADASSFLQGNYDSYHAHSSGAVHSNPGLAISRPLSASGTATTYSSSTVNSDRGGTNYSFSTDAFARDSPIHLERSQSAAPTFLSPPPGLGNGVRNQAADPNDFFHRSSSASGGGAVRPAAKTLMDLIQEGIPSDNMSPDGVDVTASPYELVGGGSHSGMNHRNMTGGKMQSSLQQQVMDYGHRSASPAVVVPRPSSQQSSSSSLQQQVMLQRQFQGSPFDQQAVASPAMSVASMTGGSSLQQQLLREQQFLPQQQQMYQQQQDTGGIRYTAQSSPPLMDQQQLLHQHQYGGMPVRQASPEVQQQGGMFVQMPPQQIHMQQQLHPQQQQQQQQQQIFYGGQQANMQGLQQQQPNIQNLQAHVLPNGQTVYVNTASTQPQSQNFGGYTTMQYQTPHQPTPMVHQQMPGEQRGQYVSVVSLQGGGQQVTYWQPNGLPQQTVHQSGMTTGSGGVPVVLNSMGGPTAIDSQFGGLPRDGKGGRGNAFNRRGNTPRGRGEKSASMTSPLLEEFRSTKTRDWTIHRIEGHVVEFCQDQNGSRFIQQRLEMGNVAEQLLVMQEVLPAIRRLRNDVFGNYVVQKLLDFGTSTMKAEIRDTLEGDMLQLSLQMYGCRVVQKALEALEEGDLTRLLREFHHNVLSFIHDQNGNHVIQKCIEVLNHRAQKAQNIGDVHRAKFLEEQIDFIIDDVMVNAAALSCHPYGCRVLQRILEHCGEQRKTAILDEIMKSHKKLLDDQYGNYVIQHVLQFGREVDRDSILQIVVEGGLLGMSRQKFASNVVEKLLKYGNGNQRRAVVREMLKPADDPSFPIDPADGGVSVVLLMVRDAYANYVVQTTLDVVPESDEKQLLLEELNRHSEELRNYTFAKHIVAKLSSLNCGH